jgi:hypothetical protein
MVGETMTAANDIRHPQRVWFEEMVDTLRSKWRLDMPVEAMIRLRDALTECSSKFRSPLL